MSIAESPAKEFSQSDREKSALRATSRALPIALLRAREKVMEPVRTMLSETGVTEQKWRTLRIIHEMGGLEQSTIAREACLLLPSLSRILQAMESDGLVTRQADRDDRRRILVDITDKGRALIRDNIAASNAIYERLEAEFGQQKLDQLLDLLEDLQRAKL
ncbi:MAG: homoprotocatechuate degradation operon regulator HpaR [Pseudomonadota bacterium]